jgi:hypothetical protein
MRKFKLSHCLLGICILISAESMAQFKNFGSLKKSEYNQLMNNSFRKLSTGVSSESDNGSIISIDPKNSRFSLQGFLPLRFNQKKENVNMSYLNVGIESGLTNSQDATVLFENRRLNTNTAITLKYHFTFNNDRPLFGPRSKYLIYNQDALKAYRRNENKLRDEALRLQQTQKWKYDTNRLRADSGLLTRQKAGIETAIDSNWGRVDTVGNDLKKTLLKETDSLIALHQKISEKLQNVLSFLNPETRDASLEAEENQALAEVRKSKPDLEAAVSLSGVKTHWFTLIASFSRKSHYRFNDQLPYGSQVSRQQLDAVNLGAQINFYEQEVLEGKTRYFNIGIQKIKTNNLDDLSTIDIAEVRTIKDGENTRQISRKYSAYTDSVIERSQWDIYGNIYALYGQKNAYGIHLFPRLSFRDDNITTLNAGIGFIFSATNKADKSILNTEAYIDFKDIANATKQPYKFYERYEVGIRMNLPFTIIFQ